MNKNHVVSTRKVKSDHYQAVVTNVQSGKCLKVLCDMVRDPDAPKAIVFPESPDNSQLRNTQIALRNLYKAVQKSRAVNDPLGMATAMEEAGKWF